MENLENLIDWTKRKQFRKLKDKYVVYKFTNLVNNKVYIGITNWVNKRIGDHIRYSKNTNNKCRMYLHKAISKYGFDKFTFEIIEIVSTREELNQREIYWINYFNSTNNSIGYNLTKGGNTNYPSEETVKKKILSSKKVKVAQYDLQGNFINKFESVKEASRQLGIPNTDIHRCHNKKWSRKGFMFKKFEKQPLNKIEPYQDNTGKNLIELTKNKLPHNAISCKAKNLKTGEIYEAKSLKEMDLILNKYRGFSQRILNNKKHKKWKITLQESQ